MKPKTSTILYQYLFAFSASLTAMTAGAWIAWPSSVNASLMNGSVGFVLTRSEISTMVSMMDLGNILSPLPTSYLMNKIGRKYSILVSTLTFIISSVSVIGFKTAAGVYVARFFAGLGKGIAFTVAPIYLAEVANVEIRGGLSTMFIGMITIGTVYAYAVGPYASYLIFNISIGLIGVASLSLLFFPESPYYLLMKKKDDQALQSLSTYRRTPKGEKNLQEELNSMKERVEIELSHKGRFIDLVLTKGNRKALMIVTVISFCQRSSGISPIVAYSSITMPSRGGGLSIANYMILFSVLYTLTNYAVLPMVDRLGRKPLLSFSSITTCLTTLISGVFYALQTAHVDVTSILWIPYACLLAFAVSYSSGIAFLPSTLVGELFPVNVKSYASCVSAMMLAGVSFVMNIIFDQVATEYGAQYMFWYFAIACLFCAVFVHFYVFETKGKTFGEIQNILSGEEPGTATCNSTLDLAVDNGLVLEAVSGWPEKRGEQRETQDEILLESTNNYT